MNWEHNITILICIIQYRIASYVEINNDAPIGFILYITNKFF